MNKNDKFVISINRELGSGGRTVGRLLAEKLGVHFYDKALIKALEEKYKLTVDEIEKLKGRKHNWWADFERIVQIGQGLTSTYSSLYKDNESGLPTTDEMFKVETEILKDIAHEESCVVAGRSGFYVFRNHPNHLSVLIQASIPYRVARVVKKQNMTEDEARKTIDQVDRMRENYVKKYTNASRYDTRFYDVVITMDKITEEDAVAIILDYINRQSSRK
jgi:cytidylate kinase